jgi:DNA-binding NarL/FixJ family response regulator
MVHAFASRTTSAPGAARVLIVDDQPAVRQGLASLLRAALGRQAAVQTAADAREALALQGAGPADVVVLDVDLAGDDGLRLLPHLLHVSRVLVLTSHADAATRERARGLGAQAFVAKSEPAPVLLAEVRRLCAHPAGYDKAPIAGGSDTPAPMG